MPIEPKHYIGEVGVEIIVDCGQVITGATNCKIFIQKPDKTTIMEKTATIYSISGQSRYLRYVTIANDLDQAGVYSVQAALTLGTWTGRGETAFFTAYPLYA